MNRRSVLRFLGFAPIAAPAAAVAAASPASIMKVIDHRSSASKFTFDASTGTLHIDALDIRHPALPEGHAYITREQSARVTQDGELASRIDSVVADGRLDAQLRRRYGLKAK